MKEKVFLALVDLKEKNKWPLEEQLQEMKDLIVACSGEVMKHTICRTPEPNAAILITKGKAQEINELCQFHKIDTVIFSRDLTGSQQRNLEELLQVKTIEDSSNNGLQVAGADEITRLAFAVDAGLAAFEAANRAGNITLCLVKKSSIRVISIR